MRLLLFLLCSGANAAPSISDAENIKHYCGTYGAATLAIYSLKERGFDQRYVKKSLIADGNGEELTNVLTDYAFSFRSGLPWDYVSNEAARFCIESVTSAEAKKADRM